MCKIRTLLCEGREYGRSHGEARGGILKRLPAQALQKRGPASAEIRAAGAFAALGHGTYCPLETPCYFTFSEN